MRYEAAIDLQKQFAFIALMYFWVFVVPLD